MSAPQRTADLQQRAPGATAGQPPPTGIIPGLNSGAPVDITSALLAVSDTERRAVFTGNVRASQSGRLLEAPRLSVSFDGGGALQGLASGAASADPATAGKSDQPRRQLREIKATGGVRLTQIGNQVLARDAVFNVVTKQAELTGGVNITSAAGRSIVADHAAIDTATNRVVLTGNVVAKQEQNLLRGSQMIYEPKLGRMYLAAPAVGAAPQGDIFARFRPPVSTGKRKSAAAVKPAGGLAFTTNPDAPVEIKARSLDVEDLKSVARFEGGVRARQGEFTLMTPVLTAHYDGQIGLLGDSGTGANAAKSPPMKLRFIRATNPVTVTSGDDMQAEGDAAEFDMLVNVVTISGNVILKRGRQIVHGDKLEIDLNTGLSRIRNSASATNERKPLSFGAAPQISSTRGTPGRGRACGGQMCAVIYPQELQKERDAKKQGAAGANTQGRPKPKIESGWSTSTRTN